VRLDRIEGTVRVVVGEPDTVKDVPQRPVDRQRIVALRREAGMTPLLQVPHEMAADKAVRAQNGKVCWRVRHCGSPRPKRG